MPVHKLSRLELPPEFDAAHYRERYPAFRKWSDAEAHNHYRLHGAKEGRIGSPGAHRAYWVQAFPRDIRALEIGPFCNPFLRGPNVKYLDVLDTAALQARWDAVERHEPRTAPPIHFVSPDGDLSVVDETFDLVASSHCIEHQIDFVAHLRGVSRVLNPGGVYFLFIPDKRYCFDHFLPVTTIADIIDAIGRSQARHSLRDVILHRVATTHNKVPRHWEGDHADPGYDAVNSDRIARAISAYLAGEFIDVHAWQFIPGTFREIVRVLFALGFSDLKPIRVYATPRQRAEFVAVLEKSETEVRPVARQLLEMRYRQTGRPEKPGFNSGY